MTPLSRKRSPPYLWSVLSGYRTFLLILSGIVSLTTFGTLHAQSAPGGYDDLGLYIPGGCDNIGSVAFSPDGRLLAARCDSQLRLWDTITGFELWRVTASIDLGGNFAWSPSGRLLAIASSGGMAVVDVYQRRILHRFTRSADGPGNEGILAMAFSPDGRLLASAGRNTVHLWDMDRRREIKSLDLRRNEPSFAGSVRRLAFSGDSTRLAIVTVDDSDRESVVRVHAVKNGALLHTRSAGYVHAMGTDPDGGLIVFHSDTGGLTISHVETGSSKILTEYWQSMRGVALSADGGRVAILRRSGRSADVDLYDTIDRTQHSFTAADVWKDKVAAAGDMVMTGTLDGFDIWRSDGRRLHSIRAGSAARFVDLSRNGRWLLLDSGFQRLRMWDLGSSGAPALVNSFPVRVGMAINKAVLRPDGAVVAIPSRESIAIFDAHSGRQECEFEFDNPLQVSYSPDGAYLASSNGKSNVRVWQAACGELLIDIIFEPQYTGDMPLLFARDGKNLLIGQGNYLGQMDIDSGQMTKFQQVDSFDFLVPSLAVTPGPGMLSSFIALEASPDGRFIAAGSPNPEKAVTVLDASTLDTILSVPGHSLSGFLPNNDVVTFDSEDEAYVWDLQNPGSSQSIRHRLPPYRLIGELPFLIEEGSLRIRSWPGLEIAAELLVDAESDWLVVTPDGLFDGTRAGYAGVQWRLGDGLLDVAPLELFIQQYYYPGLLGSIFAGQKPTAELPQVQTMDRRIPQVRLKSDWTDRKTHESAVRIDVDVSEAPAGFGLPAGGGAKDVRLFRNGTLVHIWRGDVLENSGARSGGRRRVLSETVPLVVGENRFTAYAFNASNVKSLTAELEVERIGIRNPGKVTLIVIGVDTYDALPDLEFAVADALTSADTLASVLMTTGQYDRIKTIPLLNDDATKANVLYVLNSLAGKQPQLADGMLKDIERSEAHDAVILFFAGHGRRQGDRFLLMLQDFKETAVSSGTISDRELEFAFEQIGAEQLMIVVDACYAGQALHSDETRRGPLNARGLVQLAYEKGIYLLAASQSHQQALETSMHGHGLLTHGAIVEGLEQAAADIAPADRVITAAEFLAYAQQRVPALHENLRGPRARGVTIAADVAAPPAQTPRTYSPNEQADRPWVLMHVDGQAN